MIGLVVALSVALATGDDTAPAADSWTYVEPSEAKVEAALVSAIAAGGGALLGGGVAVLISAIEPDLSLVIASSLLVFGGAYIGGALGAIAIDAPDELAANGAVILQLAVGLIVGVTVGVTCATIGYEPPPLGVAVGIAVLGTAAAATGAYVNVAYSPWETEATPP